MTEQHEHEWITRITVEGVKVRRWIECTECGVEGIEVDA